MLKWKSVLIRYVPGPQAYLENHNSVPSTDLPWNRFSQANAEEGVLCAELGAKRLDLPSPGHLMGSNNLLALSCVHAHLLPLCPVCPLLPPPPHSRKTGLLLPKVGHDFNPPSFLKLLHV